VDLAPEKRAQFFAGGLADCLDGCTFGAECNSLVSVPADIDDLVDSHGAVLAILPVFGFDGQLVRQFLVQAQCEFFARDLGGDHAQWQVGDLVFGIMPGTRRHFRGKPGLEVLNAMALFGRNHEGCREV